MEKFCPIAIVPITGLALSLWDAKVPTVPVMVLNTSQAEESEAALALLSRQSKKIFRESVPPYASRAKALKIGLVKAEQHGFTHALLGVNPFGDRADLDALLQASQMTPEVWIGSKRSNDRRAIFPIANIAHRLEAMPQRLAFEMCLCRTYADKRLIDLPGKPNCFSLMETLAARFL